MINAIVTGGAALFLALGGVDYMLGNRFGLGEEFERGILTAGRLLLCMTGFIVLSPVIASVLSSEVAPLFRAIGVDPSAFAGLLFANDSGGAALAMAMADEADMGRFHGLVVGAMMGTTVMFTIPISIMNTRLEQRAATVYGLLVGIITSPLGCLAGGLVAGFPAKKVIYNTLPALLIALFLALMLVFFREPIVCALTLLGKGILAMSVMGLVLSAGQRLTGVELLHGMGDIDEVFSNVGGICIFLAGVFPMLHVAMKAFDRPLKAAASWLQINETSVTSLLMTLANGLPACTALNEMDDRGRMLNVAFLVSASCAFGDHLAYTTQVAPSMNDAVIFGKLTAGLAALLMAVLLSPILLKKGTTNWESTE